MPPECNPLTCAIRPEINDRLEKVTSVMEKTHDAILVQTTEVKHINETIRKHKEDIDTHVGNLYTRTGEMSKEIAKKIELSTLIKGATLVSIIFGMIIGVLRLAGVV